MTTRNEIQEAIRNKDDFVKLDYLRRYLQKADNLETKKFIFLNLAAINESRGMFAEAIKNINSAGDISITFRDKIELYMKATELYIKLGDFELADKEFQRAFSCGNSQEQIEMRTRYRDFYRVQAKIMEEKQKIRKAIALYKKLFSIRQDEKTKIEVKKKLLELYERMGMGEEYRRLKGQEIKGKEFEF